MLPSALGDATEKKHGGVSDYLAFNEAELDDLIQPTDIDGVDIMSAGATLVSPDALATHRMRQLIDRLRTMYSLILIRGCSVTSTTDLQILAGYQDAVLLVLDIPHGLRRPERHAIGAHLEAGVPLLGCVRITHER